MGRSLGPNENNEAGEQLTSHGVRLINSGQVESIHQEQAASEAAGYDKGTPGNSSTMIRGIRSNAASVMGAPSQTGGLTCKSNPLADQSFAHDANRNQMERRTNDSHTTKRNTFKDGKVSLECDASPTFERQVPGAGQQTFLMPGSRPKTLGGFGEAAAV